MVTAVPLSMARLGSWGLRSPDFEVPGGPGVSPDGSPLGREPGQMAKRCLAVAGKGREKSPVLWAQHEEPQ